MLSASAKLVAAVAAMVGPFSAGWLVPHIVEVEVAVFFIVSGVLFGLGGMFAFSWLDRDEERSHLAALLGPRRRV